MANRLQSVFGEVKAQSIELPPAELPLSTTAGLRQLLEARFSDDKKNLKAVNACLTGKTIINRVIKTYEGSTHTKGGCINAYFSTAFPFPLNIDQGYDYIKKNAGHYEFTESKKTDAFMWMDRKYKVTRNILQALSDHDRTVTIVTRSDLVAHDDYMEIIKIIRDATVWLLVDHTLESHPGCPSVKRLLIAYDKLRKNGINCFLGNRLAGKKRELECLSGDEIAALREMNGPGKCSTSDS